jgi:hypothetical protein
MRIIPLSSNLAKTTKLRRISHSVKCHTACWKPERTVACSSRELGSSLEKGNGHAWAGLVLALSPRLESLDIKRLRRYGLWHLDSWDSRRFGRSPLEKLFGYVSEDASPEGMRLPDLTAIAGLRILKKQKYFGQESINVSKNIPTCT